MSWTVNEFKDGKFVDTTWGFTKQEAIQWATLQKAVKPDRVINVETPGGVVHQVWK